MLPVTEETDTFTTIIYTSTSGAILAFVISFSLFINVILKYGTITKSRSKNSSSSKVMYLMVLIYFSFISLSSLSYAFVRTNVFTHIENEQFTKYQCSIGFLTSYLFYYLCISLLYIIFIFHNAI